MKIKFLFIVVTILGAWFGCKKIDRPAQPNLAVVGLAGGDTAVVAVADTFSATFMIRGAKNVYAVNALVIYDTTFLSIIKAADQLAQKGNFLGNNGILQTGYVGGIPGAVVIAYSKQTNVQGNDGEGELWKVSMLALKPGLTKIGFDASRCFVLSPNEIAGEPERLPARFDDKLLSIKPTLVPNDTSIVYILIKK